MEYSLYCGFEHACLYKYEDRWAVPDNSITLGARGVEVIVAALGVGGW